MGNGMNLWFFICFVISLFACAVSFFRNCWGGGVVPTYNGGVNSGYDFISPRSSAGLIQQVPVPVLSPNRTVHVPYPVERRVEVPVTRTIS